MRRNAQDYPKRLKGATTMMRNAQRAKRRTTLLGSQRRIARRPRTNRALLPVALALMLILGMTALLGTLMQQRSNTNAHATSTRALLVARADFHAETEFQGKDLELNLAISQTENDCQAALNGGICLRYSVVLDENPVMAGYGVIPMADVRVTPATIGVTVDTRQIPHFVHTVGAGGRIAITWKTASQVGAAASAQVNRPQKATAQGVVASYPLPGSGTIATIIYR